MGIGDLFKRSQTTDYNSTTKSSSEQKQSGRAEIHPMLQRMGRQMLRQGQNLAQLPFMPNRGARVAAFSPGQRGMMDSANLMAQSLGFAPIDYLAGMPQEITSGGIAGYGTGDIFDATMAATDPEGLYKNAMMQKLFGDPRNRRQPPQQPQPQQAPSMSDFERDMLLLDAKYKNDPRYSYGNMDGREHMTEGSQWRREYGYAKDRLAQKYGETF